MCLDVSSRKPLPEVEAGVQVDNELDRNIRSNRKSVMQEIERRAIQLREEATDVKESLHEIENYLAMLKNLTVEVKSFTLTNLLFNWGYFYWNSVQRERNQLSLTTQKPHYIPRIRL